MKLVGMKWSEFNDLVESKEIFVHKARLIPLLKAGDELALTTIFLSALKLVKEYQRKIFKVCDLSRSGTAHYFTEVSFASHPELRIDGMILIEKSGVIFDALFLEMKSGKNQLDAAQLEKYISLAKSLRVSKMLTISNQYVHSPEVSPVGIKQTKSMRLFHLSWVRALTIANILIVDKDEGISDIERKALMQEILHYFENPKSGVIGFNQMKQGWKEVAESINKGITFKKTDPLLADAIMSWKQEEQDIALMLSRKLGQIVTCVSHDSNTTFQKGIEITLDKFLKEHTLFSKYRIKNVVSDMALSADFETRTISSFVVIKVPRDKGTKGQINWLTRQLHQCLKKSPYTFQKIQSNLHVQTLFKFKSKASIVTKKYSDLNLLYDEVKTEDLKEFRVTYIENIGSDFCSNKKIVARLEEMVNRFYGGVVQHVTDPVAVAPKIRTEERKEKSRASEEEKPKVSEVISGAPSSAADIANTPSSKEGGENRNSILTADIADITDSSDESGSSKE